MFVFFLCLKACVYTHIHHCFVQYGLCHVHAFAAVPSVEAGQRSYQSNIYTRRTTIATTINFNMREKIKGKKKTEGTDKLEHKKVKNEQRSIFCLVYCI